jgi:hypothetical protein
MKLFVAMPFANEYDSIYAAITEACRGTGVEPIRADELLQPGPIINQILGAIDDADFVLADVTSKNPNVLYEVGLAHCTRKPTLLLAAQEAVAELPFDIRHNRVVVYDRKDPSALSRAITAHVHYFAEFYGADARRPDPRTFFAVLSDNRQDPRHVVNDYIEVVAKEFQLVDPKLVEEKFLSASEGYLLVVQDAFGERVTFLVDPNGLIRRKKRL